jgi:hypothetical protein
MTNLGGPIMSNPVSIYNIWYGARAWLGPTADETIGTLDNFFYSLTGSNYMNLASLYGATTSISFGGDAYPLQYLGSNLTRTNIGQIVTDMISANYFPYSTNAIYNVFTAPDVRLQENGFNGGITCGFHSDVSGLKYTWVGEMLAAECTGGTLNDGLTIIASHELFETLTDPFVSEGSRLGPPYGWIDTAPNSQGEIADMCEEASFQATMAYGTYAVQSIFVSDPSYSAGGFCSSGLAAAVTTAPEPATLILVATGLVLGFGANSRKRVA